MPSSPRLEQKPLKTPMAATKPIKSETGNGNGTSTSSAPREKLKTKTRKRSSPFRIKVGCIVALRYRSEGNDITIEGKPGLGNDFDYSSTEQAFSEVWADPQPGRDEGLALIGCRVRCCFPKVVTSETFQKRSTTRYLEGEVVSIPDHNSQWEKQRAARRRREATGTKVELLVDRDKLDDLPFLKRAEGDVDVDVARLSESAKRHFINEQRIKGEGKVTVEVVLGDYMFKNMKQINNTLEARWVIRKRVPVQRPNTKRNKESKNQLSPGGEKNPSVDVNKNGTPSRNEGETKQPNKRRKPNTPKDYFIGNGNDSRIQQEANWRWRACRCHHVDSIKDDANSSTIQDSNNAPCRFTGEVVSIQPAGPGSTTLAYVTMKRVFLPEQTRIGRMSHHKLSEVFDSFDCGRHSSNGDGAKNGFPGPSLIRVPIEQLIIISRKLSRSADSPNAKFEKNLVLEVTKSYSQQLDVFFPLSTTVTNDPLEMVGSCFRCKGALNTALQTSGSRHVVCDLCQDFMQEVQEASPGEDAPICDCSRCQASLQVDGQKKFCKGIVRTVARNPRSSSDDGLAFPVARGMVKSMNRYDFSLTNQGSINPVPSIKPITRKPAYKVKASKSKKNLLAMSGSAQGGLEQSPSASFTRNPSTKSTEPPSSCSRILVYNAMKRNQIGFERGNESTQCRDRTRNKRLLTDGQSLPGENEKEEKIQNSRAVRANQRRLLRDVSVFGVGLDTLAGREQALRFDRSTIHAWGVFADEDIKEGEMVIEYRGEIVGNTVAEAREIEYEKAKIGSDYMFRIDNTSVCDATKQGNVARFINASCDPNCFTKIISIGGKERIVVYAKRDISSGEELCYDYKFPLDYEENKRIPCGCRSPECRGFLNWDKRYVVAPEKKS